MIVAGARWLSRDFRRVNMLKIIVFAILATAVAAKYHCTTKTALLILKRPTYEFSVRLLDRVSQETDQHFVFSPISTYMQLLAFAEGARGNTSRELWNVTRYHRSKCFRRKWKLLINKMDADLAEDSRRKSVILVDRFMRVNRNFVREVKRLKSMEVLSLPFNYPERAADTANKVISRATQGVIEDTFSPYDFNYTVLLTADTSYYRSDWQKPFNPVYTSVEKFYSQHYNGEVRMMNSVDYFNIANIAAIRATVLELPCGRHGRVSMLIILPDGDVGDVFYNLQKIRLMSIFNTFKLEKQKLVHVKLPRFKIRSDVDNIPELLYDMGVRSLFHPNFANLRGISDYKVYASLMTHVADIQVDEKGVRAGITAEFLVSERKPSEQFVANKPFAFMLVDRKTEVILFAGVYSMPNVD